jgi:hypothetical protein
MADVITCPSCQYENEVGSAYCLRCGTVLLSNARDATTLSISEQEARELISGLAMRPEVLPAHAIALYVMQQPEPILVENVSICVLGRHAPEEKLPVIDLSAHGAYRLGVSRRHVMIRCSDTGCAVEDLGSSNGTWLNGTRLEPFLPHVLQNGDQVRLGLLSLQVYFGTVASGQSSQGSSSGA